MPIYEYQCTSCGARTEAIQSLSDAPLTRCPECGGVLRKLLSPPAFQFKGSGWYVTDYAGKKSGDGAKTEAGSAGEKPAASGSGEEAGASQPAVKAGDAPGGTKASR